MGQSLFMRIFWGITWFQEGTRGKGGAGFSTRRGNSEKIDCQSYGIIRTLQSLMGGGGGGAEESLIVTHPRDK